MNAGNTCFVQQHENFALLVVADQTFLEWDNDEDRVYDDF